MANFFARGMWFWGIVIVADPKYRFFDYDPHVMDYDDGEDSDDEAKD